MILLDTNVISEPLRPRPSTEVLAWLDDQLVQDLHLSAVTVAEVRFGIASLPAGKRRRSLASRFDQEVLPLFEGRILPFDVSAAEVYGALKATARAKGHAMGDFDALIASIAAAHSLAVATRDVAPFHRAGLEVINPFDPH